VHLDPLARTVAAAQSVSLRLLTAVAFGLVIGTTSSLTWPATGLVLVAGALVLYEGRTVISVAAATPAADAEIALAPVDGALLAPAEPDDADTLRAAVLWAAWFVVFCLWELAAFLLGNNEAHPTFSMLTDGILAWYPTRALAGFVWMVIGWRVIDR
jgi:hypothetical protein